MSKKPLNPLEDPPTASSSSDDDEVESSAGEEDEEVEDSSSSSSSQDPIKTPSSAVTIAVPGKSAANSGSGSETETDSDSETDPPKNQPIPGSGKSAAVTVVSAAKPTPKPAAKRVSEGTNSNAITKRAKKGDEEKKTGEETKKPAFHRLWSEEDEISVLQGMIDFKSDTGKSPYEDSNGFYEFIKKSISFEVSKNQFMDKIRSLKKKFMAKEKNGVEPVFSKQHDQKSYDLSKFIWGPNGIALESAVKSNGVSKKSVKAKKIDHPVVRQELSFGSPNGKKVEDDVVEPLVAVVRKPDWFENSFLLGTIAGLGVDEHCVKQRWGLVADEKKKKVEEKLKALQAKELEFVLEKSGFLHEVTSMMAEASKNKSLDI